MNNSIVADPSHTDTRGTRRQHRRWIWHITKHFDALVHLAGETGDFLWDEHPEARERACASAHILEAIYHLALAREALS